MAETGHVEPDGLCMMADLELDRQSLLGKSAGGDGTSVDNLKLSWHGLGLEADVVAPREGDVDERRRGTRVDHCEGRDLETLKHEVNGENDVFFRVETRKRD